MTISYERFTLPLNLIVGSQLLTARAAARHMVSRGRGAIVFLPASLTGQFIPYMSGITAACGAVEALSRTLATELGPAGVRVNCVRAGWMPETRTIAETTAWPRRWACDRRGGWFDGHQRVAGARSCHDSESEMEPC